MLRLLRIRNLAVIEAVEVEFEPGFNVLTGARIGRPGPNRRIASHD